MITATLTRTKYQPKQVIGTLQIFDKGKLIFICDTLELPWLNNRPQVSCIPTGTYDCEYRESAKYPQHYWVKNVPGRSWILIHQANFVGSNNPRTHKPDLLGCIGVGNGYGDLNGDGIVDLLQSRATLNRMLAALNKRPFKLTIQ
jgi:hypothetical protein